MQLIKLPVLLYGSVKPNEEDDKYLIVSYWFSEENFKTWTKSPEFLEGHKRGFEDIKIAKEKGEKRQCTLHSKHIKLLRDSGFRQGQSMA